MTNTLATILTRFEQNAEASKACEGRQGELRREETALANERRELAKELAGLINGLPLEVRREFLTHFSTKGLRGGECPA